MDMQQLKKESPISLQTLRFVLSMIILTAAFSAIGASLLLSGIISQNQLPLIAGVSLALSSLTSSLIFGAQQKTHRLSFALLSGVLFVLILIALHMVFFTVKYQNLFPVISPVLLGVLLPALRKGKQGSVHRRKR